MKLKLETSVPARTRTGAPGKWVAFLTALREAKKGQSFCVYGGAPQTYRAAVSTASILLGRKFMTAVEGAGLRVWRIE